MAGAEAVSPELDDENTKNNETTDSAVPAEICEEKADSENGTAGLLEPEVTLNEGESSGNPNENPVGSVQCESDTICSTSEVPSQTAGLLQPEVTLNEGESSENPNVNLSGSVQCESDTICSTSEVPSQTAGLLQPEVTLNEGESSGNPNENPVGSVQCESDTICSTSEVPSEPNVNISTAQPTATDCENTSSNCVKELETAPSESDPSELLGDPSINVFPVTDLASKISSDSEGSSALENCIKNITTDGAEGTAETLSDAFSAETETETGNVNGIGGQGSGSTGDLNVKSAEFLSTDSNFRELKSKSSEAFGVSNTEIPDAVINNASELICNEESQQNSSPGSRDDVQNEPYVTDEGKQTAINSDTNSGSEKSDTKLVNFDDEEDAINVQNCESEKNSTQVCASNRESALNCVNIIESTRDTNSRDSTSTNCSNDTTNSLWHKKNVLNSHYYPENVTQYCTNSNETSGVANVLKSLKPCSVILERLDTNVIATLKNVGNSPSGSFELSIDKSNKRTVVSAVKNEALTFDPADSDRFTSQNASGEYIMKENKVKPHPRTPRTARNRKRKRRRTISSSSSGILTGSESDRTICNDENKSAIHSESEISRQETDQGKREPDQKKLKTVEEDRTDVEDTDVNPARSVSNTLLKNRKDTICNAEELKDISSVGITCGQDDSSDLSVAAAEDPLTLDNRQMTDQENSEDSTRKDNMDAEQVQISASISLCQNNHTTLPEDVSTLHSDFEQENQETAVFNTERSDLERTQENTETNQEAEQSGDCFSHENGIDTEDRLNLTVGLGEVSNRTESEALNGTSTSENKDSDDFGNNEMPLEPNSFEESTRENSLTDKKIGPATCIIPDEHRMAPIEGTPEVQNPEIGYLSAPFDVNVADKSFTDVPGRQQQKSNRGRKSFSWKSNKQPEQKSTRPQRQAARKAETQIKVLAEQDSNFNEELEQQDSEEAPQMCFQCCRMRVCEHQVMVNGVTQNICSEECVKAFQATKVDKVNKERTPSIAYHQRKCRQCQTDITGGENHLAWETMEFCQEECLAKFQKDLGGFCCFCKGPVPSNSLGKYCVRFGFDIRQFCRSTCLEEFKKGLKVCSYCQKDISGGSEGFLAPVGDRGQFKEFCSQKCMEKYDFMSGNKQPPPVIHQCAVCNNEKLVTIEVMLNGVYNKLCSEPCFAAFKFVNRIIADQCNVCRKYFDLSNADNYVAYYDDVPRRFCCRTCMNVFILANRRIVPCNWCKVKKYNFDMIKRVTARGVHLLMCSLNCLALYLYSTNATPTKRLLCDMCSVFTRMQYHLAMSDSSIRNFCSYVCVMKFQDQFKNTSSETLGSGTPIPTGGPKKTINNKGSTPTPANDLASTKSAMPVISSVTSLACSGLPAGSGAESGEQTAVVPVTRESSSVNMSPSVQADTKVKVVMPVSSESVTTKVSAVASELETKQPVPVSVPVPVSDFISTEINKIDTTKQATSSPQTLPAVLDKFSETTSAAALPVAAVGTATTNSTVSAAGSASLAVISNALLGTTSPVDAVLPDSGDGPDASVDAQKTQSISMVPEKFLAKPSSVGEIFSVETALALATGVQTDSSTKAATQQSTSQPWRVTSEELPETSSAALATTTSSGTGTTTTAGSAKVVSSAESDGTVMRVLVKEVVCIEPEEPPEMKNVSVLTKPILHSKGISCRPHLQSRLTQTDMSLTKLPFVPVPIPIPIYVPCPMHMYTSLFPVPMPFPLPIPVPTIIPTTKNTLEELIKEIQNIREKLPENPAEAELLTMAEMVASEETEDHHEPGGGSHSDDDEITEIGKGDESAAVPTEESNQEAQKENEIPEKNASTRRRTRKSSVTVPEPGEFTVPSKVKSGARGKPDAHLTLKYTLCLKAWHVWVKDKNKDLEIAAGANYKPRFIKPDILELTAEELNYALCLFVTEAKKPSGTDYPPDVVFYFCLGIQYYLYECGRVDNIFTDPYYIKFTDCLDKIVQSFMAKQMASDEIFTRVMEEHLWESKQLGAHSPDVLLTTLMFFNTKYFNLVTVDDHMQLSFAHIMKHWKRPGQASGGTTSALLRFYPPSSMTDGKSKNKKKKKYEQQENEENPLRCPVKLYEFYLSKCPDSVKTRSDLFYLQPERSCVPDSPVWYTTTPLGKDHLTKMLNRLKIVKEINEAIYCS